MNYKDYITEISDFPKPGVSFKDISPLLANKQIFKNAIEEMGNLVVSSLPQAFQLSIKTVPDYWVGIDARGFIFASALSMHIGGGVMMCRKSGKLPPPVISEEYELEYGTDSLEIKPGRGSVIIVDDVYATGGTMKTTDNLCKKAGYNVIGKLVLIDLLYLHDKDELVQSLVQYE